MEGAASRHLCRGGHLMPPRQGRTGPGIGGEIVEPPARWEIILPSDPEDPCVWVLTIAGQEWEVCFSRAELEHVFAACLMAWWGDDKPRPRAS